MENSMIAPLRFGNKKGQAGGGLITGLVFGIASLVIGVIIALVITSTLDDASLLTANSAEDNAVGNLTANFTSGINEVSDKLPTVLLVAAIVLILSVLAVLVGVWQRMKFGGGSL
jgi:multisubunit Na+/H+ antiporter MnhC subunit